MHDDLHLLFHLKIFRVEIFLIFFSDFFCLFFFVVVVFFVFCFMKIFFSSGMLMLPF